MIHRFWFALAVFVVAACGSVSTPTASPVAACALIPNMDELVGKAAVGSPGFFTLNNVDRCIWTYATDPARSVGVSVAPLGAHQAAKDNFPANEAVEGLGDDAVWFEGNHLLSVAVGQRALQVDLQLDEGENTRDLAVSIAQAALSNLH